MPAIRDLTTILEAIYFLAAFTSFQTSTDRQIVNFHEAKNSLAVARLVGDYQKARSKHRLEVRLILEPTGVNGQRLRKEILLAVVYALMSLGAFGMVLLLSREGFEAFTKKKPVFYQHRLKLPAGWKHATTLPEAAPEGGAYAGRLVIDGVPYDLVQFHFHRPSEERIDGRQFDMVAHLVHKDPEGRLAVVAVLFSLIGAFYYLRVVKVMYFDEAADTSAIQAPAQARAVLSLNGAAVLVLGVLPGGLMAMCAYAIKALAT